MKQTDRQHGADKVNSAGRRKWRKAIVTDSAEQDCHREVTPAAEARRGAGSQMINLPKWIKWFRLQVELFIWNIISVLTPGCNTYFNPILLLNLIFFFFFVPWHEGKYLESLWHWNLIRLTTCFIVAAIKSVLWIGEKWIGLHSTMVAKNKAATPKNSRSALIKTDHTNICN